MTLQGKQIKLVGVKIKVIVSPTYAHIIAILSDCKVIRFIQKGELQLIGLESQC